MPKYSNNPIIDNFYKECATSGIEPDLLLPELAAVSYLVLESRNYFSAPNDENTQIAKTLERYASPRTISFIKNRINKFDNDTIIELIESILDSAGDHYYLDRPSNTGNRLTRVIYHILGVKDNDSLCNLGCSNGATLVNLCLQAKEEHVHLDKVCGTDANWYDFATTRLLCTILFSNDSEVCIDNSHASEDCQSIYTKGYVYPPTSARLLTRMRDHDCYSLLYPSICFLSSHEEEWVFVDRLLAGLSGDNVKAVAHLFGKSLRFANDSEYVQQLIKDGWIESIIALPQGIVPGTAVQTFLVVFSRNNSKITFVDTNQEKTYVKTSGFNLGHGGRTYDMNQIISAYDAAIAGEVGDNISLDLAELEGITNLIPQNVIARSNSISSENSIPISSVSKILAGCQYTIRDFEITREKTGCRILTSSDINDGIIDWNNLNNVVNDKTLRPDVFLHKNDVIVTTKSTIVKVAVVEVEPDDQVIVTGGMIIVRPNTALLNPTYLKMYLESDDGVNALKTIQTGSVITHISPRAFETLSIPDVNINVQNKKARRYNEMLIRLASYKNDIKHLERELKNVINDDEE